MFHEAGHQAWGYPLYALHRAGKITDQQREAGDAYYRAVDDYRKVHREDLDEVPEIAKDFTRRRIERAKNRYAALVAELGLGRKVLDALIFEHEYPVTERQLKTTRACLEKLAIYFGLSRKLSR